MSNAQPTNHRVMISILSLTNLFLAGLLMIPCPTRVERIEVSDDTVWESPMTFPLPEDREIVSDGRTL